MELFFSVVPIFFLILLGYILKQLNVINEISLESFEKLNHYALFPIFVLYKTSSTMIINMYWLVVFFIILYVLVSASVLLTLWQKTHSKCTGVEFTSIFQGSIRFNIYVTLATVLSLFGTEGLDLAVVLAAIISFVTSLLSILIFYVWGEKSNTAYRAFFGEFIYNPLFICFALGFLMRYFDIRLPYILESTADIAGMAAIPLGLIILGATLKPRDLQNNMTMIFLTSLFQFMWKPLFVIAILIYIENIPALVSGVLLMMFVSPTSTMSYILAKDLEGNKDLMRSIITIQTMIAFFIIPLVGLIALQ